jgi:hypothetical protein
VRDHLERYLADHEDLGLVKMLLSGSLAKGLALRTINDVDVALYVKGDAAPSELDDLLTWILDRLRTTYSTIPRENIRIEGPCVVLTFTGTDLDVEITPILYFGDPEWRGYLWDKTTRNKVLTSIPLHKDFTSARKDKQPLVYSQVIRLAKWWARQRNIDKPDFVFRSFLIELIMAHLADRGTDFSDYHHGLEAFFTYICNTGLKDRIAFSDNYPASKLPRHRQHTVEIFDPVTPENNVAHDLTSTFCTTLIDLAGEAADALAYAKTSQTKSDALECWQDIMGSSFDA